MDKLQWAMTVTLAQPEAAAPTMPEVTTNTPQQPSPANTTTVSPPGVTTSNADSKTAAAPVEGANSFTMGEAPRRIEPGGFSHVTSLKKDGHGVWPGQAMRGGTSVSVFCGYQGNVGAS